MKEIKVVIGKNFGDEGKGATVHRLCKGKKALVVRHNGGAQAGHTVEEGSFRFVFHELGSGSLCGCPTYWSRTFLPDLLKLGEESEGFLREAARLEEHGTKKNTQSGTENKTQNSDLTVYADPACSCTTIYDVILNSLSEELRGSAKHGSCGMGIFEADLRTADGEFILRLGDFQGSETGDIARKLVQIRDHYARPRLELLKKKYQNIPGTEESSHWYELFEDDNVLWNVAEEMLENFNRYVKLEAWENVLDRYDTIIFENAQGLMLDKENTEYFPHLTPSHTGLHNIAEIFRGAKGSYEAEIIYVSRTYVTRHGMGRLDHECAKEEINSHMVDKTNVPNYWQDSLRYGKHPVGEEFWKYICRDLKKIEDIKCFSKAKKLIYVNHLDETDGKLIFADGMMDKIQFEAYGREKGNIQVVYCEKE